ncbi:MAG: hypothetical protein GX827_01100 [Clostridiales bacterium]|jgi:hypothetical protein|nr:hypothetical protein [Clostridiales bacterium]
MNNRPAALILTAIFLLAALPVSVMALPYGWWPLWSAYTEALDSGNEDALISAGDNVIKFYSDKPMDGDIAGQQLRLKVCAAFRHILRHQCGGKFWLRRHLFFLCRAGREHSRRV